MLYHEYSSERIPSSSEACIAHGDTVVVSSSNGLTLKTLTYIFYLSLRNEFCAWFLCTLMILSIS